MGRRQAVRHRILIPAFPGSIPGGPAKTTPMRETRALKLRLEPLKREMYDGHNDYRSV